MRRQLGDRFSFDTDDARSGGFATVYRGVDLAAKPPREVAIKILNGEALEVPLLQTFFDREVESLLTLEHENIVELIDAGVDDDGRYFLALEWVENDLRSWISAHSELGWEDVFDRIALPLAKALAFAHERHVIHRDIKPANVLIDAADVPKLADFGIAKIKSDLTSSPHTTVDFMSRPYSPPEQDSTYSRDVFGFGVLALGAISGVRMKDYPDIDRALDDVDLPADVSDLIRRCVSLTPEQRPKTGVVLFEELGAVLERRRASRRQRTKLHLALTNTVEKKLSDALLVAGPGLRKAVCEDLGVSASVRQAQDPESLGQVEGRQLFLGGDRWSYRAVVQVPAGRPACLLLVGAQPARSGVSDRAGDRDRLLTEFEFTFEQPLNARSAHDGIHALVGAVDTHLAKLDLAADDRERRRLLEQWRAQLAARQALEKRRSNPVKYLRFQRRGRRVKFELHESAASVEVGELRRLETERQGLQLIGEVESAINGSVEIRFESDPVDLPPVGRLVVDNVAANIKIDREKAALLAIIHNTAEMVEPGLREVVIDPATQPPPRSVTIANWFRPNLDADKQDVVAAALGSSGMFAVEGPPGTGKTTFISELVAQFLDLNPGARVLISSQTNVALDNALERVADFVPPSWVVRLSDRTGSKVADGAKRFLLDAQLEAWRERTEQRSRQSFNSWCGARGVSPASLEFAGSLRQLAQVREGVAGVQTALAALEQPSDDSAPRDPDEVDEDRKQLNKRRDLLRRDAREIEQRIAKRATAEGIDLTKATPAELRILSRKSFEPLGADRARVEVFNAWTQRMGRGDEFVEALLTNARVLGGTCIGIARYRALRALEFDLCIVDEASKATATETLVPLVRSKRWVLVGDQRQLPPFQEQALADRELVEEFDLDVGELETTLFDRMLSGLPDHSRRSLVIQRRMTEAIGELVSQCFYEGCLQSVGPEPLPALLGVLDRPITWWTTSSLPQRHELASGTSLSNPCEIRAVRDILGRLAFSQRAGVQVDGLEVLLLAPYSAQVAELRRLVEAMTEQLTGLHIEVNTIDAVQGREADLVLFSTVRSNPSSRVGFLASDKRVNVALSRARRGLIIVGDSVFLSDARSPLKSVLGFLETHPHYGSIQEVSL